LTVSAIDKSGRDSSGLSQLDMTAGRAHDLFMSSERVRKLLAEAVELPTDERVELVNEIARTLPNDRAQRLRTAWAEGVASLDRDGPQLEADDEFEAFLDDAVGEASRA
jgi:hypothetical protein